MKPSSTSNSDSSHDEAYQTSDPGDRLRVAVRTLLAGVLVFGSVVGCYNGLLSLIGDYNGRVVAQLEHLPLIVAENRDKLKVFVVGSSMVQAGFEPTVFDRATHEKGIETISYNYGVGNLDPNYQVFITRRIRDQFLQGDEKLALTLLEFNPFQATIRRSGFGSITADQNIAVLASDAELWQMTLDDPTRGIRLFNIRYLRDGLSAELITSATALFNQGQNTRTEAYRKAAQRTTELWARFNELRDTDASVQGSGQWNIANRGGRIDKSQLSREALDALGEWAASRRYSGFMENDLARRVRGADILELEFDERSIEAFIAMVEDLKVVSETIEVILLPRNTDWVNYAPDVQRRLDDVLRRIESSTGVGVRNYQVDPRITPEHFLDTTHFSYYDGIDVFTKMLAEDYSGVLGYDEGGP